MKKITLLFLIALSLFSSACNKQLEKINQKEIKDKSTNDLFEESITEYTKAIESNPKDAKAYNNRGWAYAHLLKDYTKAIMDYDKAIELESKNAEIYLNRGQTYYSMKEYTKALSDINKAIELDSSNADAYNNRGNVYAVGFEKYSKAVLDFDKAITINSDYAEAYYNRGFVHAHNKKQDKACKDWQKAYSLGKRDAKDLLDKYCK